MIFWDSSAVVPLVLAERRSDAVRTVLVDDRDVVVWWCTPIEVLSAVARAERADAVGSDEARLARAVLEDLEDRWNEIAPSDEVRERGGAGLMRHPLRAADALQLGAALTWARGRPRAHAFLSLDARLAEAARLEGFDIVTLA